mmetsp:Transcript_114762/g.244922  ORF Transcript_114762/g.244922 Transcript_114762/m.244922 type:complete len:242 (-) Transcript_114762:106-831(-)
MPPAAVVGIGRSARQPVKQRGRSEATDELRARCIARVREGREQLLSRLRELSDDQGCGAGTAESALRGMAREVLRAEVPNREVPARQKEIGPVENNEEDEEEQLDVEALLALEAEILRELQLEAKLRAIDEAESFLEMQNEEDCALYEQHMLGGVPCPLCGSGRLERRGGELCCTSCPEMRAAMMDEDLPLEEVFEMLGSAEEQHFGAGCSSRARFEVCEDFGQRVLYLSCNDCGWHEVVL